MKTILFLCSLALARAQGSDSADAVHLLLGVQQRQQATRVLAYRSSYRQVNYGIEDSVFVSSTRVWLERQPADTIFGFWFHARGEDRNGRFDYYYDGRKSLEIRHREKQITQLDPFADNSEHSPAKRRLALIALPDFLTDDHLVGHLLKGGPSISLTSTGTERIVVLHYPLNKDGVVFTKTFFISAGDLRIDKAILEDVWNGVRYKAEFDLDDYSSNPGPVRDSLALLRAPAGYVLEVASPGHTHWVDTLTGKPARDFSYRSFGGDSVHLGALRGRYVFLDFWESWCGWCIDAIPHIKELEARYGPRGVVFLGIVTDNLSLVRPILDSNHVPYPTLMGDQRILRDYAVMGRPLYVLVGPDGKIIAYAPGDLEKVTALLAQRLP